MNKSELIKAIAEKTELSQITADKALEAMTDSIVQALINGESVTLPSLGILKVAQRAARSARNPKTGETIQVPASKAVSFKTGKNLKYKLN